MNNYGEDRISAARKQYQAKQAREKRVLDLLERMEKPGMKLKMSLLMVVFFVFTLAVVYRALA